MSSNYYVAIKQDVDKFPAGFVEELLRKEKRVILTGVYNYKHAIVAVL